MVKIVRVVFLLLFLLVSDRVAAEGSRDFYPTGASGKRAFLVGTDTYQGSLIAATSYPFITRGAHYAYVNEGEFISAASSRGTIILTAPNGTTYNGSGGQITSRALELSGSRNGYTGFEKEALPGEEGVWKIEFVSTGNVAGIPNVNANTLTQSANVLIAAWDVSVFADGSTVIPQNGRVYANVLNLMVADDFGNASSPTNKDVGFYGIHYVLTKDGFAYKVSENGAIGVAFTFFVNGKGFTTAAGGAGTQTYKSVASTTGVNVKNPSLPDNVNGVTHKIFYNKPDHANLPETAAINAADGGTTWLLPEDIIPPTVSAISIVGVEDSGPQVSTKGAKIRFNSSVAGTYKITIPGGSDFITRVLTGPSVNGDNEVYWDGKAGLSVADPISPGTAVPPGTTLNSVKVQLFGAEVHFPFLDVEANPSGIIIEQLTTDGNYNIVPGGDIVYWDDRTPANVAFTGGNEPNPSYAILGLSEISSNANGHKWGGNPGDGLSDYGNTKALDTYTFVPGLEVEHIVGLTISQADLEVTSVTSNAPVGGLNAGSPVTYTIVIKNLSTAQSISDVTGATFGFEYPAGFTVSSAVLTTNTGTVVASTPTTTSTRFSSTLSMTSGSQATYVISGTAGASLIGSSFAPTATMLRPADIADPDATDGTTLTFSNNPYTECAGLPSGAGCNNIKVSTAVSILDVPTVAAADLGNVDEDQTLTVDAAGGILANETPAYKTFAVTKYTIGGVDIAINTPHLIAGQGTITIKPDGSYVFAPVSNFNGPVDVITYTVNDGTADLTSTLTITVNPINDVPLAAADNRTILQGAVATINTAVNDADVEDASGGIFSNSVFNFVDPTNPALRTTSLTIAGEGNYVIAPATGVVTFTPFTGFNGVTTPVKYTIEDSEGAESLPATITVTVKPFGSNDEDFTPLNTPVQTIVKSNDGISANNTTVVLDVTGTTGTVAVNDATGIVTYSPPTGFTGKDVYKYKLRSLDGVEGDPITVTINVKPKGSPDNDEVDFGQANLTTEVISNDALPPSSTIVIGTLTNGSHGTVVADPDGVSIIYTPTASDNFSGLDTYSYTLKTADGVESDPIKVSIKIKPGGANDLVATTIGTAITSNVKANDLQAGAGAVLSELTQPAHGSVSITGGSIKYVPEATFTGIDTYTYKLRSSDGQVYSDEIVVNTHVNPVGTADNYTTSLNQAITSSVVSNDQPGTGATLTVGAASAKGGTLTNNSDGTITYTPGNGFTGVDTYTYTITTADGNITSSAITVTINVKPAGVADEMEITTGESSKALDVLTNDTGAGTGTLVSTTIVDNGVHGEAVVNPDQKNILYTRGTDNFTGVDTYTYKLVTTDGVESDPITVRVKIKPVGANAILSTNPGTPVASAVLNGATTAGTGATVVISDQGDNGTVTQLGDGSLRYTPDAGFTGRDIYKYKLISSDGEVESDEYTITVNVNPIGTADSYTTSLNQAVTSNVISNDHPGTGAILTVGPLSGRGGKLTNNNDGTIKYEPATGFTGVDTYTYTITTADGNITSPAVTVTINVKPVGVADEMEITTAESSKVLDVLANDAGAGTGTLVSTTIVDNGDHGNAVVDPVGKAEVTYTRTGTDNFTGVDTYTYKLVTTDGVESDPITVKVKIKPVGADATLNTTPGAPVASAILNGATTAGTGATIVISDQGDNGTVTQLGDGSLRYTPDAGFTGQDTYKYKLISSDGEVESTEYTITVNVNPIGTADSYTTSLNQAVTSNVISNDQPGTGAKLTVGAASAENGTLTNNNDGTITYTPANGFTGVDTYTYTITTADGNITSPAVTVTINVKPAGVADEMEITTAEASRVLDVLANDTGAGTGTLVSTTIVDNGDHGNAVVDPVGKAEITYTRTGTDNFTGVDTYTYKLVTTDGVESDPITVKVKIKPVGADATLNTNPGTPVASAVLNGATTAGTGATIVISDQGDNGTVTQLGDGSLRYTPDAGFTGRDTYKYKLISSDGEVESDEYTITVNVNPIGTADSYTTSLNQAVTSNVISNDQPGTGAKLTVGAASAENGTLTNNNDGTITYTPANGFTGVDTYTYTITTADGNITSPAVTVTINVKPAGVADEMEITTGESSKALDVLTNDTGAGTGTLVSTTIVDNGVHGEAVVNPDQKNILYTRGTDNFTGVDTYTYKLVTTDGVESDPITVRVKIKPVGANAILSTNPGTPVASAVLNGATTAGTGATVVISDQGDNGTVTQLGDGSLRYTPDAGFTGRDTYKYKLISSDGEVESDEYTITVNVNPIGTADSYTTSLNQAVTSNVISNDHPGTGAILTVGPLSGRGGKLTNNNDGTIKYEPATGFTGVDTYTYTITTADGNITSPAVTVTINVKPAGVADEMEITTAESSKVLDVLANDAGAGTGTLVSTTIVDNGDHGNAVVDPVGKAEVTYTRTGTDNFTGVDTYTYKLVTTDGVESDPITVKVKIKPVGADATLNTTPGAPVASAILNGATTAGTGATIVISDQGDNGTVTQLGDGSLRYTPDAGFTGQDTYKYKLISSDGEVESTEYTITVNVIPIGTADSYTTSIETTITNMAVQSNDQAGIDATVAISPANNGSHGTAIVNVGGTTVSYTPEAGYTGQDSYQYTLKSEDGLAESAPVTVTITVKPAGTADSFTTSVAAAISDMDVMNNDIQAGTGATIVISGTNDGVHGTAVVNTSGLDVTYTPEPGFAGEDIFKYTIRSADGLTESDPITVTVNVKPEGLEDEYTTKIATPITSDVITNDNAGSGSTISVVFVDNGLAIVVAGKISYTPDAGFTGKDTYTYQLTSADGKVKSDLIEVTINIKPVGTADAVTSPVNTVVTTNVKNNDGLSGSETSVVVGATSTKGGTLTNNNDGTVTYTPATNFVGTDTYTYQLKTTDGVLSDPIVVTVTLVSDPKITFVKTIANTGTGAGGTFKLNDVIHYRFEIKNEGNVVLSDINLTENLAGVTLSNPTDNGNDGLLNVNEVWTYTGTYTVTQQNVDEGKLANQATVTAKDPINATTTDISGTRPDNDRATSINIPQHSGVALVKTVTNTGTGESGAFEPGNSIEYTFVITNTGDVSLNNIVLKDALLGSSAISIPDVLAPGASKNYVGTYLITDADINKGLVVNKANVKATDPSGQVVTDNSGGTGDDNDPTETPVVKQTQTNSDVAETKQNFEFKIPVLNNDVEGNSDMIPSSVTIVNQPAHGTVTVNSDGTVTYKPDNGYTGADEFTYTVTDKNGQISNPGTVAITVNPTKPVAVDNAVKTTFNTPIDIKIIDNDQDDGAVFDESTIEIVTQPQHGTVRINTDGTVTYTPNVGYTGDDLFSYRLKDVNGNWTEVAKIDIVVDGFFIPNAFSPNGDGKNDLFFIVGLENYQQVEIAIFNRWGNEVYRNSKYQNNWDAQGLNEGTYYYLITLHNGDSKEVKKGWLLIKK